MTSIPTAINMKFDQLRDQHHKEVYFAFFRKDIYYQDTYYMFKGTETMFNKSIEALRAEVFAIQYGSRAVEDELLDTPMDTWSNSPDDEHTQSHWVLYDFASEEEYDAFYDHVRETGLKNAYYNCCVIRDIGDIPPTFIIK